MSWCPLWEGGDGVQFLRLCLAGGACLGQGYLFFGLTWLLEGS